jgi:hypothetical protein
MNRASVSISLNAVIRAAAVEEQKRSLAVERLVKHLQYLKLWVAGVKNFYRKGEIEPSSVIHPPAW